ncbi:MAG: hypothetical protein L6R42_007183 [Xanthoria sp. 1 TBL-2021]|nr:MAG: hypothetical protein L6R42_007183 [Xanthoria sp. 1 TBL-2021]
MKTRVSRSAKPVQAGSVEALNDFILQQDPVKLVLLPQSAGPDSRICTLTHPSTSKASRYYWCPRGGLYEFQKVAAPRTACRSWLLGPKTSITSDRAAACTPTGLDPHSASQLTAEKVNETAQSCAAPEVEAPSKAPDAAPFGHTVKEADISIATSIDVLFFALPSLHTQTSKNAKGLFLSMDDLFDTAFEDSMHLKYLLVQDSLRQTVEARIAAVCDEVDAGDERMYRLNMDKLVLELVAKARRMSSSGLPRSMEAKFVDKALEAPVINLKRDASSISTAATETIPGMDSPSTSTGERHVSITISDSIGSDCSNQTNITVPDRSPPRNVQDHIKDLLRLRTALSFIMSSYLSTSLASAMQTILDSPSSPVDFKPLDEHLAYLGRLRAEALASRSLTNISRKRSMVDDDEAAEAKAEKRRKKEEEEKRQKAGLTKGIRELKKVDVTGMKKMSDFFGRKPI